MNIGTKVWVQESQAMWIPATIVEQEESQCRVQMEDGSSTLVNAGDVELRNETEEQNVANLISLAYLHEASILSALHGRYTADEIYTQIGDILLAINPFKKLKLYSEQHIQKYNQQQEQLAPHVYLIAKAAYENMSTKNQNQSILVSGESGAGKTEATKIMMRFLASIAGNSKKLSKKGAVSIEKQVLQSNPILEAFGNARTIRNDNSSRFGKFIEIQFNDNYEIAGARIRTYLLERVRLIKQAKNERNFHIFYELLAGATDDQLEQWGIERSDSFHFVNKKKSSKRKDGVCDRVQFQNTMQAMTDIGMKPGQQKQVLAVVAALLHLGNIEFDIDSSGSEQAITINDDTVEHLDWAAKLLNVGTKQLESALLHRKIMAGNEILQVKLDGDSVLNARNALAMSCYGGMFRWLVARINSALRRDDETEHFIGLLDIFGFENVQQNSFEQLCINYANEALQQQFNRSVFEHEQEIYRREKIRWNFIDFPNNDLCLQLFERKPMGIFALLDQECLVPGGSDAGVALKYYNQYIPEKKEKDHHPHFRASPHEKRKNKFLVVHYAGEVCYNTKGFISKNKDCLYEEAIQLLKGSSSALVQSFAKEQDDDDSDIDDSDSEDEAPKHRLKKRYSKIGSTSVGTQFKAQLINLLDSIDQTTPHYIRCIKPNDENVSSSFNRQRVVEQLRSGGVLEAVRVARAGFPVRLQHSEFVFNYQKLVNYAHAEPATDIHKTMDKLTELLQNENIDVNDGAQIGATKVFFKKQSFEQLQKWANGVRDNCATAIQSKYRSHIMYRKFRVMKRAVNVIQCAVRCLQAKQKLHHLRQNKASICIQRLVRKLIACRQYWKCRKAAVCIQSFARKWAAQKIYIHLKHEKAATELQSMFRCYVQHKQYRHFITSIIVLQARYRGKQAHHLVKARRASIKKAAEEAAARRAAQEEEARLAAQEIARKAAAEEEARKLAEEAARKLAEEENAKKAAAEAERKKEADQEAERLASLAREVEKMKNLLAQQKLEAELAQLKALASQNTQPQAPVADEPPKPVAQLISPERVVPTIAEVENQAEAVVSTSKPAIKADKELPAENVSGNNQTNETTDEEKLKSLEAILKVQLKQTGKVDKDLLNQVMEIKKRKHSVSDTHSLQLPPEFSLKPRLHSSVRTNTPESDPSPRREYMASEAGYFGMRGMLNSNASDATSFYGGRMGSSASAMSVGGVARWNKSSNCHQCQCQFTFFTRRHHCRACGFSFCHEHSTRKLALPEQGYPDPVRVCDDCFEASFTQHYQDEQDLGSMDPGAVDIAL